MKNKDSKKKSTKASEGTKKIAAIKAASKKVAKVSAAKTALTKKSASIKYAATKSIAKKKAVTVKAQAKVMSIPKAKISKIAAIKPKPVVEAEKKISIKKTVTAKAKVAAKPKAKVSKVAAIKPKPAVKAENRIPLKKTITAKTKVTSIPKAKVSKIAAIKPKPVVKAEKKIPIKKTITAKTKVMSIPKAKISKIAAIKPKPVVKAEKKIPLKKTITAKTKVTSIPKAKVSKIAAIKPKPVVKAEKKAVAAKREPDFALKPSFKSVSAIRKSEINEESKLKAEPYPLTNSRARLKIFLPEQNVTKEEAEDIFFGELPDEYGENSVIALVVDPNTVFVDWEVIPKDIFDSEGNLNLRFYDITGIEFNDWKAHSVLDVPVNKRVGSGFFDIRMPGCDMVVAVGILNEVSGFMPIVRSDMISFPELLTFDELGIVQKLFESGIPVGY